MDAVLGWHESRQHRSPARGTHGIGAERLTEADRARRQSIQVGGIDFLVPRTTEHSGRLVVDEYEDDVRRGTSHAGLSSRRWQRRQLSVRPSAASGPDPLIRIAAFPRTPISQREDRPLQCRQPPRPRGVMKAGHARSKGRGHCCAPSPAFAGSGNFARPPLVAPGAQASGHQRLSDFRLLATALPAVSPRRLLDSTCLRVLN